MADFITVDEMLAYMGIDYADDMVTANIQRAIRTANAFLISAIGEGYPTDDPKAKELALIIAADLYDNRGLQAQAGGSVSANTRKLVDNLILQLQLEYRRAKNG